MAPMMLQSAVEMATRAHAGEWRDGETPLPYISHPMEVLMNLRFVGMVTDTSMLCAAILHDTVEAGALTLEQIEKHFGQRVRLLVEELTRVEPTSEVTAGLTKDEVRKLRSQMLLNEVAAMSLDAQQIKLADRLANLRDAKRNKSGRKLRRYLDQTSKMLEIIPAAANKSLWDAIEAEMR